MRGERIALFAVDGGRVDEVIRRHGAAQRVAQGVRHRVINRDVARHGPARGSGVKVRHATRERRRHDQPARVGVVFHVILRRMGEDDGRRDFANDGRELSQRAEVVKDFEIVAQAGVKDRIQNHGGASRFAFADFSQFRAANVRLPHDPVATFM